VIKGAETHRRMAALRLLDRFSRWLPALPRKPGARRKNAFPNGWEIYGARTMAIPTKLTRYALLSFPLLDLDVPRFPSPRLTHADPNNFYSLFGQTRSTMRRDVSILEQTAPACRLEMNLQGSVSMIIPDESTYECVR